MRIFFQLLLSLLTFAVLLWAVWQGYLLLRGEQLRLEGNVQALVIISVILFMVCTFVVASAIRSGARTIALNQHYQSKKELYETFLLVCQAFIREPDPEKQAKMEQSICDLKTAIALQASQPVIKAVNELLPIFQSEKASTVFTLTALEKLLVAMRQDLGQTNYFTTKKELKKMFTPLK